MVPTVPPPVKKHRETPRRHPVGGYFHNIRRAVVSTFEGMTVTMSWMFRRPMTVQYPDRTEKPVQQMLPSSYRGILEVDLDRCTACLRCEKECPLGCISIEVCKNPVTGNRDMSKFDIDIGLCMYCGLCAEACNFDALDHTREFEGTMTNPDDLMLRFVREPREVTKLKAAEMPPRRPKGSILARMIPTFGRRNLQTGALAAPETPVAPRPAAEARDADEPAATKPAAAAETKQASEPAPAAGPKPASEPVPPAPAPAPPAPAVHPDTPESNA